MVGLRPRRRPRRRRDPIHAGEPRRLLEEPRVGQPGRVIDQVDRAGALARREVEAPAGILAVEMDEARALVARRAAGEVGATKRPAVTREPRLREELRQPVGRCRRQLVADGVEVEARGRGPDLVQIDDVLHVRPAARGRAQRG